MIATPVKKNQVRTRGQRMTAPGSTRRQKSKTSALRGHLSRDNGGPHKDSAARRSGAQAYAMKPPRASSGMAERRTTPDPCNDHHSMVARARSTPTKGVASAATSGMKATTRSAVGARDAFATEMISPPTATRTAAMAYQSTGVVKR